MLPCEFREPILHRRSEPKKGKDFITTPWMMVMVTMVIAIVICMAHPLRSSTTIFDVMVMMMMVMVNDLRAIKVQHMGLVISVKRSE